MAYDRAAYAAQQERIKAALRKIVEDEKGKVDPPEDGSAEMDVIMSIGGALGEVATEFCDEEDEGDVLADLGLTVVGN